MSSKYFCDACGIEIDIKQQNTDTMTYISNRLMKYLVITMPAIVWHEVQHICKYCFEPILQETINLNTKIHNKKSI